jgi:flavodoxin I
MAVATILIAYASLSGSTEEIADLLKSRLEQLGHSIDLREMEQTDVQILLKYDAFLIGAYTWGDGELPYEAEDFYEALLQVNLTGKKAAVFGSGDTAYAKFCEAVDILEQRIKECGADLVCEGLKIEYTPSTQDEKDRLEQFAVQFAGSVRENVHE